MKTCLLHFILWLLAVPLAFASSTAWAEATSDKTLSPYFQILSEQEGEIESLPLESTSTEVKIAGVIADVRVSQTYRNRGNTPIDAIYVFPASTRAAVYGMTLNIGERVVHAKIKGRAEARSDFLQAKTQGKRASLLEQERPNVFQMNVANIMPKDLVRVDLRYTEIVVPEHGVYEFVYPGVVGPRYSNTPKSDAADNDAWVANPYLPEGKPAPFDFDIKVSLSTGIPIQGIQSTSHEVDIRYESQGLAHVGLKPGAADSANRDYILQYQLQGQQIESGLLLYPGQDENFFLLMTQPPKQVAPQQIPPREYIFVVDVSGSMYGFPLDITKDLMKELLSSLKPTDRFNILFFSGGSSVLAESSLPATQINIQNALSLLENIQGSGGTELLPALKQAMAFPAESGSARSFVIVTDGYVMVEKEAFDYVRDHLNQANFFAFGIGASVNRYLIEGLARAGRGEPFVMTSSSEARVMAKRFKQYIETPVLTGIEIDFGDFEAYDVEPSHAPDLFAEKPLIVFGKWRGEPKGSIRIQGRQGENTINQSIDVANQALSAGNEALRYLWARQRIAELGDYQRVAPDSKLREEIQTLGLAYNLLTDYTSFIAVDEVVANPNANSRTVKQPLPLPQGVSNLAVGGIVPTTPEPELFGLVMASLLILLGIFAMRGRAVLFQHSRSAR